MTLLDLIGPRVYQFVRFCHCVTNLLHFVFQVAESVNKSLNFMIFLVFKANTEMTENTAILRVLDTVLLINRSFD